MGRVASSLVEAHKAAGSRTKLKQSREHHRFKRPPGGLLSLRRSVANPTLKSMMASLIAAIHSVPRFSMEDT